MADRSTTPPEIKILQPKNLNLRMGRNALPNGYVDRCHGLWPKQTGTQVRIPGKTLMRQVGDDVLQIHQAYRGPGIIFQIGNTEQYFTLDQLNNRQTTPSLTASVGNEEDQVGMAIITQTESNTTNGGSAEGWLTGPDTTSLADTFYGRRLTNLLVNETVSGLQTVNSFGASTGGSGAASTPGQFALVAGTYRIEADIATAVTSGQSSTIVGLYNTTSAAFATYSGTAEPILATVRATVFGDSGTSCNAVVNLSASFTVSAPSIFQLNQKVTDQGQARALTMGGVATGMSGANVNGAAARNTYTIIKIWRFT